MISAPLGRKALLALAVGFALASSATAALKEVSFEELTRSASRIVHGKVVDLHSFYGTWSHASDVILVTEVTLEPISVLKGEASAPVVLRIAGGRIGDLAAVASESPVFELDQEVVVFLDRHELGFEYVRAHWHGKYDVVPGVREGEPRRVRGIPGAPLARSISLAELARRVDQVERAARLEREAEGDEAGSGGAKGDVPEAAPGGTRETEKEEGR